MGKKEERDIEGDILRDRKRVVARALFHDRWEREKNETEEVDTYIERQRVSGGEDSVP